MPPLVRKEFWVTGDLPTQEGKTFLEDYEQGTGCFSYGSISSNYFPSLLSFHIIYFDQIHPILLLFLNSPF
jgi:hypothetical protein